MPILVYESPDGFGSVEKKEFKKWIYEKRHGERKGKKVFGKFELLNPGIVAQLLGLESVEQVLEKASHNAEGKLSTPDELWVIRFRCTLADDQGLKWADYDLVYPYEVFQQYKKLARKGWGALEKVEWQFYGHSPIPYKLYEID